MSELQHETSGAAIMGRADHTEDREVFRREMSDDAVIITVRLATVDFYPKIVTARRSDDRVALYVGPPQRDQFEAFIGGGASALLTPAEARHIANLLNRAADEAEQ